MDFGEEERYAAAALYTLALHLTQVLFSVHTEHPHGILRSRGSVARAFFHLQLVRNSV